MLRVGSLCTGYGGLDLAVHKVFDGETVWTSDIDKGACKIIEARFPGAPNIGDLTAINWRSIPSVDVITAGYPCQPFSLAGKREGLSDSRHIWPYIANAIGVLRPRYVVLENVRGHLSLGGKEVVQGLALLGYDSEWALVRASDVGACHRRERMFILATDASCCTGDERPYGDGGSKSGEGRPPLYTGGGGDQSPPDPHSVAREETFAIEGGPGSLVKPRQIERVVGLYSMDREWGKYLPAIERHAEAVGRPAPQRVGGDGCLNPRFVEWMMMLPYGWVCDVITHRASALKALGNGVVPRQAEHALRGLLGRA